MRVPTRGEIAAAYDAIAEEYDAARPRPWPETLTFEAALPRASRILDLGCGGGRNLAFLRTHGHAVVGLDASRGVLRRSAAKVGASGLVLGDLVGLPFRDRAFDAVHCMATLHHLPSEDERRQTVLEVARVLRPGGLVLFGVWALEADRFRAILEEQGRRVDGRAADVRVPWRRSDGLVVQRFYHLFHAGELEGLIAANLAVERAWREGDNHVVIAAKRAGEKGTC